MRDRSVTIGELNQLRLWIESNPEVPEEDWFEDFGTFKICGQGSLRHPSRQQGEDERVAERATQTYWSLPLPSTRQVCSTTPPRIP
jgi:hypothetical protein